MKYLKVIFLFLMSACVSDISTPEGALKDFIDKSAGKVMEREEILSRVTGKLRASLENITEEEFSKTDFSRITKESLKIHSKTCQDSKKCFLTYTVSYQTTSNNNVFAQTEVKKIAEIDNIDGQWLIADVSNIKTYLEILEPISPLETTK